MKKTIILFLFISFHGFGQQKINKNEQIYHTAKIWGFLKYYHPIVAQGSFDWDFQLIQKIQEVQSPVSKEEFSLSMNSWIRSLGEIKKCLTCEKLDTTTFNKNLNLSWLKDRNFDITLQESLQNILNNRHQGFSYYVQVINYKDDIGVPTFTNEKSHEEGSLSSRNINLLTLIRYWNTVEYFFPYKYLMGENWDEILIRNIPKFKASNSELETDLLIRELVTSLDDGHAVYRTHELYKNDGTYHAPVAFSYIENSLVATEILNDSLAKIDNWNIGDQVTHISGKSIEQVFDSIKNEISGSNYPFKKNSSRFRYMQFTSNSTDLTVNRKNEILNKPFSLFTGPAMNYRNKLDNISSKIVSTNIGYIDYGKLYKKDINRILSDFKNTKGLIIDLRKYPNPNSIRAFIKIINQISTSSKSSTLEAFSNLNYPGTFIWRENHPQGNKVLKYDKPVVLLVNSRTLSQGEYLAMTFQTGDNVYTIGSQTAGADGAITTIELPNGETTNFSSFGVFYPNGDITQRTGIRIDEVVYQTVQGIRENRDEILETGIKYITNSNK